MYVDLTGQRFGSWTVLKRAAVRRMKDRNSRWLCRCDCGRRKSVLAFTLVRESSSGCMKCKNRKQSSRAQNRQPEIRAKDPAYGYRSVIAGYKNGARKRKLSWSLSDTEAAAFLSRSCDYCGVKPKPRKSSGTTPVNGIDRFDNRLGYELNNIVTCCTVCNFAKGRLNPVVFLSWLNRIGKKWSRMRSDLEKAHAKRH